MVVDYRVIDTGLVTLVIITLLYRTYLRSSVIYIRYLTRWGKVGKELVRYKCPHVLPCFLRPLKSSTPYYYRTYS